MKKKILITIIIAVIAVFISKMCFNDEVEEVNNSIERIEAAETNTIENTVKENASTTEIQDLSIEEEKSLEEQDIESESFELERKYRIRRR